MELQVIQNKIYEIRNYKVMFDFDLAKLYQVETKVLNQAVKRNIERFEGNDFMFKLTDIEMIASLRSQFVTLKKGRGQHFKYAPYAFTELGIAMLSSVLKSETAIKINREIMRTFVLMREIALNYTELSRKLENYIIENDAQINDIYQILDELTKQKKTL